MAVAFASYNTQSKDSGGGTSVTVTKPTGLAAGDFMIAIISCSANRTPTLAGWDLLFQYDGGNPPYVSALVKVASAGDAAASNFTFSGFADGDSLIASISRITGTGFTGTANCTYAAERVGSDDTPTYASGITTRENGDLLILGAGIADNQLVSTQAVANNNPSWTEQFDVTANLTNDLGLSVATASFATAGATGNYSLSIAGGLSSSSTGFLIGITENKSVTVSPAVITMTASIQAPTVTGDANVSTSVITMTASVQAPTVTTAANPWTETSKTATSWTETSKS